MTDQSMLPEHVRPVAQHTRQVYLHADLQCLKVQDTLHMQSWQGQETAFAHPCLYMSAMKPVSGRQRMLYLKHVGSDPQSARLHRQCS